MRDPVGDHRHFVRFENPGDPQPDGDGGFTEGWTPADPATWYVSIKPATARDLENVTAGTVIATATHIVRGRCHPGITTETRMIFEGRTFAITNVSNIEERDQEMQLICEERLN